MAFMWLRTIFKNDKTTTRYESKKYNTSFNHAGNYLGWVKGFG